jgi:AcrR family transcriptional regulator
MAPLDPLEPRALFAHPLCAAVVAVFAERGFPAARIEEMVARAGVDRAEFDRLFDDKEDAAARVTEAYVDDFERKVGRAYASAPLWPDSLRAAAYAATRWIREFPEGTRFGMVSSLEAGEGARLWRERVFRWSAGLIDEGRRVAPDPDAVPDGAALMAVGAVAEMLSRQVQGVFDADPVAMVPQLMYAAVRPYLGEEAAGRELTIPPPPDLAGPAP